MLVLKGLRRERQEMEAPLVDLEARNAQTDLPLLLREVADPVLLLASFDMRGALLRGLQRMLLKSRGHPHGPRRDQFVVHISIVKVLVFPVLAAPAKSRLFLDGREDGLVLD